LFCWVGFGFSVGGKNILPAYLHNMYSILLGLFLVLLGVIELIFF
jgi:hypothetical protein